MDGSEAVACVQEEVPKKRHGLENMSKEELIKKCKNLLTIAQKAKEAKDEANEEVKTLKEKLNAMKTVCDGRLPKENDETKENHWEKQIGTMQEIITNLTDQKLRFTMEMDTLKKKTFKLEEEVCHLKESKNALLNRVSDLEIERDGFQRQARRLEEEAESLTLAMGETERQGNEALSLCKTENNKLKKELEQIMSKSEVNPCVESVKEEVESELNLTNQLDLEKEKYNVLHKEVELFVSHIKKPGKTLEMKSEFKVLNLAWEVMVELENHNFKLSQEITQLKKADQEQIRELTENEKVLHSQIQSLKAAMAVFSEWKEKLEAVEAEKEALCVKVNEFKSATESQQECTKEVELERDTLKTQVDELEAKLSMGEKEKLKLMESVEELQTSLNKNICEENLEKILSENRILHRNICQAKDELVLCQNEMIRINGERESLTSTISQLRAESENMKIQLTEALKENEKLFDQVKMLKNETEESSSKCLEMQSEKQALEEKMKGLQSAIEEGGIEKEELLKVALDRNNQLKDLEKETKEKLNAAEVEKADLRVKIEELEKSCQELTGKNSSIQEEMEVLVERLKPLEEALEQQRIYKENSLAEREALRLENETLKESSLTQVKLLEEGKVKLEQELQQAVSKLEKKASCEVRLTEVESDRRAVISELESLRLMLSESEGEKDQFRDQNDRLKEAISTLEERLRAAEEGAEGVREALENKVNSLQSTLREKEALELKLTEMRDTLVRTKNKVQEIDDAKNLLEGESRSLRESLKEQNKVLERLLEVEEGKDGMEREIEALRASLKEEGTMKSRLEAEKLSLEKEVAALRMTVKDEDKVMERLREVEEEKDGMEREIEALRISLKDESRLRETLRNEHEVIQRELESVKSSEAKVRENLRAVVERSSLLEKEVEELKLTLKEHSMAKQEVEEALAQKELLGKEVEELKLAQGVFSKLEENLNASKKENNVLAKANEDMLKQSSSLKKKIHNAELEKEALGKTLQDVRNLVLKWEETINELYSANVLDKISVSLMQEVSNDEKHEKTSLMSDIGDFGSNFSDVYPENIPIQEVIQALRNSLNSLGKINKKSEDIASDFKKIDDEKLKLREDMEKKLLSLKTQHEDFKKKKEVEQTAIMKDVMAIRESIGTESNLDSGTNSIFGYIQETSVQIKQIISDLNDEILKLKEVITVMEGERKNEKDAVNDLQEKVKELEKAKCNAEQQLISEMKGANTVLKKRGEAIAAFEAEIARLSSQLLEEQQSRKQAAVALNQSVIPKENSFNQCDTLPQVKVNERKVEDLDEECRSLRLRVSELEKQINVLSIKGSNVCDNVGSEVLSTSTISKTEEVARLRDVEESFEDRYTKLRMVAVKLKKRCTELEGERKRADELQGRVNNLSKEVTNLSTQAKNAKSLQVECDRLQDNVDELGKQNGILKKALKDTVDESTANKIQVQDFKEEKNHLANTLEVVKKEKTSLEASLQEANAKMKNAEKEIQKLEQDLNAVKLKLSQKEACCADALKQLEEGKQTWKRGNVLSLEMDALEQSAEDLRRQLEESREEGTKLKASLRQTEEELGKSKLKEEEAKLNRDLLKETQAKLADCEKFKNEANENVECLRRDLETQSLQLGKLMAETKRQSDSFRTQQEAVLAQASALEAQVTRLRSEVVEKNMELEQVRSDFAAYKVRAQAVLLRKEQEREAEGAGASRRDKEEEEAKEQEWERERRQLERVADGLKRTLEDVTSQLDEVQVERESLHEKSQALEMECQRLRDSSKELEDHYKEDTFQARIKLDTLVRSYQQQLEELQNKYRSETLSLREQVQKLKEEKETLISQQSSSDIHKRSRGLDDQTRGTGAQRPWAAEAPLEGRTATEMALHPREEGEGSESVDSPPSPHSSFNSRSHGKVGAVGRRKKKGLLPLDQLLSSSLPDEEETDVADQEILPGEEDGNVGDWVSGHHSSYNLVATLERRSKHLSLLLSEAESEGARLAQQNALLKEEVRRLERCAERTEHTQNAEYLKNVLIKFITLQGGDERSCLVPVLTTILKLSPEETHQLNAVASGGSLDSGQVAGAARGWGSYLHLWPSAP